MISNKKDIGLWKGDIIVSKPVADCDRKNIKENGPERPKCKIDE